MVVIAALLSVALFMLAFFATGIVALAGRAVSTARGAMATMRDPAMDDDAREAAVQKASIALFGAFGGILLRSALALLAAAVPIYGLAALGVVSADAVIGFLSRWDVIIGLSVVITLGWIGARRLWPST